MIARAKIFKLPLQHSFGISRWSFNEQKTFIVSLSQNGFTGYGEATENKYYDVTVEKLQREFNKLKPFLEGIPLETPWKLWEKIKEETQDFRFLMAAIDEAAWDLYGKIHNKPVYELLDLKPGTDVISTYTIGLDEIEVMKQKILEKPWPVYKIKLGTNRDKEIIRALREVTASPFRVDANAAWNINKTIEMSRWLKERNVEFIEQPLPAGLEDNLKQHLDQMALPVLADESCKTENDLQTCLETFHGINVKLTKAGGITPAYEMLKKAKNAGKKTMVGCMTESTVGISAAAQLLGLCDYADLDGALLLAKDLAEGDKITARGNIYPVTPGNGVVFKENL